MQACSSLGIVLENQGISVDHLVTSFSAALEPIPLTSGENSSSVSSLGQMRSVWGASLLT